MGEREGKLGDWVVRGIKSFDRNYLCGILG